MFNAQQANADIFDRFSQWFNRNKKTIKVGNQQRFMQNRYLIGATIATVGALGLWYYWNNKNNQPPKATPETKQKTVVQTPQSTAKVPKSTEFQISAQKKDPSEVVQHKIKEPEKEIFTEQPFKEIIASDNPPQPVHKAIQQAERRSSVNHISQQRTGFQSKKTYPYNKRLYREGQQVTINGQQKRIAKINTIKSPAIFNVDNDNTKYIFDQITVID